MSYRKKVIVLSSVLALLLAIWGAGFLFSPERVAARAESARLISGKGADVASILLAAPGSAPVELAKSGSLWELVDAAAQGQSIKFPVRQERVASFLGDLEAVKRLRLVARGKDSWSAFKLDEAQAKRATLKDGSGKVLAELFVGDYGPAGSEVYLRRAGSDSSYLAEGSIASYLSGRSGWLDLALLAGVKEADVQSIAVKSDIELDGKGKPARRFDYLLRRDDKGWKSGAAAADAESVASLLRSVVGLRAEDFVAAPPPDAFKKVEASIALELGSGSRVALEIGGDAGSERRYARLGARVATLSTYSLRACLKSLAELAKK